MFNQATLIGRLGADPEVRFLQDGSPVANLRVATDERWKNDRGENMQRTEWHRAVCFGKLAEIAGDYLAKGRLVMVQGRLQTRKWQDAQGIDRYSTEIVVAGMKMLDSGKKNEQQPAQDSAETETMPDDDVPF